MRLRTSVISKLRRTWGCPSIFSFLGSCLERKELRLLGFVCTWLNFLPGGGSLRLELLRETCQSQLISLESGVGTGLHLTLNVFCVRCLGY